MKKNKSGRAGGIPFSAKVLLAILIIYAASILFVYIWAFFTSLKSNDQFMESMVWPTWPFEWDNYKTAFSLFETTILKNGMMIRFGFVDMLFNSLIYCALCGFITVGTTWIVAYITASFPTRVSRFIYAANIVLMSIPIIGSLPSSLQFYKSLNLYDTWGYVAVSSITFTGSNYMIIHAFISGLSKETQEAAIIDGAGRFTIMLRIILPQTMNIIAILLTTSFITHWNSYMAMVVWLPSKPSLMYGMYRFSTNTTSGARWPNMQMAGAMILMAPILVLFIIFKDKIIGGVKVSISK